MIIKIVNHKEEENNRLGGGNSTGEYHKKYTINKTAYVNSYSYIKLDILLFLFLFNFHIFI